MMFSLLYSSLLYYVQGVLDYQWITMISSRVCRLIVARLRHGRATFAARRSVHRLAFVFQRTHPFARSGGPESKVVHLKKSVVVEDSDDPADFG